MSSSSSGRVPDTATAAMRVLCRHLSLGLQGCAARSNRPCQPGLGCPWFQAEAGTAPPSGSHGIALRLSPGISLTTPIPPAPPRPTQGFCEVGCCLLAAEILTRLAPGPEAERREGPGWGTPVSGWVTEGARDRCPFGFRSRPGPASMLASLWRAHGTCPGVQATVLSSFCFVKKIALFPRSFSWPYTRPLPPLRPRTGRAGRGEGESAGCWAAVGRASPQATPPTGCPGRGTWRRP